MLHAIAKPTHQNSASGWVAFVLSCLLAITAFFLIGFYNWQKDTSEKTTANTSDIAVMKTHQTDQQAETDRRFGEILKNVDDVKASQKDMAAKFDQLITELRRK